MILGKRKKLMQCVSCILLFGLIMYVNNCYDSWIKSAYSTDDTPKPDQIALARIVDEGTHSKMSTHHKTASYVGYFTKKSYNLERKEHGTLKSALLSRQQLSFEMRRHEVCGDKWQERYKRLHEDILQARRPRRFLVYSCKGSGYGCGGYGNRLNAIASLFLLAALTDRAFIIDWSSGISMDMFWEPKNINWKISLSSLKELESRTHFWGKGAPEHVTNNVLRPAYDVESMLKWGLEENIPIYLNRSVEIVTNIWYLAHVFLRNPSFSEKASQLGLKNCQQKYTFLGCAFDFLFQKTPTLEEQINEAKASLGLSRDVPLIGLHVRIGDEALGFRGRKTNDTQVFFECAKQAENRVLEAIRVERDRIKWFLATDDSRVKSYASQAYPGKVVTLDITPQHIDRYSGNHSATSQGMLGVLLDHFILSESTLLILSKSTFGLTAQALDFHSPVTYSYGETCIF